MATLRHELWINAPTAKVYEALSTAEGVSTWWDQQGAVATPDGTVLEHSPGPEHGVVRLRVVDMVQDQRVEWECISTHPPTSPASAWAGTHIVFELTRRRVPPWAAEPIDMAIVDFRHSGWDEDSEYFGFCNFAWGIVLQKLQQVCESRS